MVQSLPTDTQITGDSGLGLAGSGTQLQIDHLLDRQGLLSAPVCAALLCERDTFPLAFANQRPLELGKGPHHREEEDRHRSVFAREREVLLHELDPHPSTSQRFHKSTKVVEIACQPIHTVDHNCVAITDEFEQLLELRPEYVLAGGLVGEDLVDVDPVELSLGVLVKAADADVANPLSVHEPSLGGSVRLESMSLGPQCQEKRKVGLI